MEKFIALCLVIILLICFPLQYALQQKNHYNISMMQTYVNTSKEEARQKGYFTPNMISSLRQSISERFGVDEGDVVINVTTTPKYRTDEFDDRELIEYEIGVPVKKLVAVNKFFGISDEDNTTVYYIRGAVPSELLP